MPCINCDNGICRNACDPNQEQVKQDVLDVLTRKFSEPDQLFTHFGVMTLAPPDEVAEWHCALHDLKADGLVEFVKCGTLSKKYKFSLDR